MENKAGIDELVKSLYAQAKSVNANYANMHIEGVLQDPEATLTVSVSIGVRPANKILDDLYEWADENNKQEVLDMLEKLEEITE